jgi:hypothetical protein
MTQLYKVFVNSTKFCNFLGHSGIALDATRQLLVDRAVNLVYKNCNRTPHASASVSAPGGSFFALNAGTAGFQ